MPTERGVSRVGYGPDPTHVRWRLTDSRWLGGKRLPVARPTNPLAYPA
jgi:hypothetical protein